MNWQHRIAATYPLFSGLIFLGLGLITLFRPEILEYYGISADSGSARTAIRAMIGGGEVGFGIVMLGGGRLGFSVSQRCTLAATIFFCVGLARLLSAGFEGNPYLTSQPLREASIELGLGCFGVLAAARNRRVDLSSSN